MELLLPFLIAIVVSVVAPATMLMLQGKQKRADQLIQWAREDEVAARARADAQSIVASNEYVATVVNNTASATNSKLEIIHTLVNSQLTAAMESERDAITRELAMMEEVITLKHGMNQTPGAGAIEAIRRTQSKLEELETQLIERYKQQEIVDMQLHQEKNVGQNLKATLESAGVQFTEGEG